MKLKLSQRNAVIGVAILMLLATFTFLGFTGVRTLVSFFLIFTLPAYLLLDLFPLKTDEKFFIGTFLGLGLFAIAVFYINRIVPSLRLSVLLLFAVIVLIWIIKKKPKVFSALKNMQ